MSTPPARVRPRFLTPALDPEAGAVSLPPDEARHLTRVLRLGTGAMVSVFDGRGCEWLAEVVEARDSRVTVRLLEPIAPIAEPVVPLTLIQAVLKGASMDDVVRDATMMGVASIQPVITAHVAVKPAVAARPDNVDRWRRVAIASAKQSRRATIPEIAAAVPLAVALAADPTGQILMFVEPSADRATRTARSLVDVARPAGVRMLIGPEGGWDAAEIDLAESRGAWLVTLGSLTLRADAMPVAAIAVLRMVWE